MLQVLFRSQIEAAQDRKRSKLILRMNHAMRSHLRVEIARRQDPRNSTFAISYNQTNEPVVRTSIKPCRDEYFRDLSS